MKAKTKQLVILSDLHCGGSTGLWPKGFKTHEGFEVGQNGFQEWLWECWEDLEGWIKKKTGGKPYELLLNGDLIEGVHHRTIEIMTPDPSDMVNAAIQVLGPLSDRATRTYLTTGTSCHVGNTEAWIGREIGAVKDPDTGHHVFPRLELEYGDHLVAASHHISTTGRPYLEASALSMALGSEIQERARTGKRTPTILIKGHRHVHGIYSDGMGMCLVTGAWQGLTRHAQKVVSHAIPRPSCFILNFEDCKSGDLPLVHQRIYIAQ